MKALMPLFVAIAILGAASFAAAQTPPAPAPGKPATGATIAEQKKVLAYLPFNDKSDFEDAKRGFIARPEQLVIKDAKGRVVWELESYKKYIAEDKPAPDTVNPSLYRNAQLNMLYGLFKVTDRVYQIRGYDLSVISFIQGDTGWIVIDPLISRETARAALDFINEKQGKRPVVAVIYSHSHVDHYGGVRGLASDADFASGRIPVIAPQHFTEHAISENVIAGNVMSRRAVYMYGALLPRNPQGGVNGGLGQTTSTGDSTLVVPSKYIGKTGETMKIDGVDLVFQMTPGTEAPAEMNAWFPQFKAMFMAENSTNTMHNVLTLRGAQVRDALIWSHFLNETIEKWGGQVEVKFQAHHWPQWGSEKIVAYWQKQADLYKYTHDQTVNLMNKGYTGEEISEMIQLPPELDKYFPDRGYYGTLRHNSRAVYQRYMGWYNGNPSDLNNLPPVDAAKKYVAYIGGEAALLQKARADFDKGEYRWVAEVCKHAVFANPDSKPAKDLLADAYEQLGYQAESGPWRSVYLMGAFELRNGVPSQLQAAVTASPDTIKAMPPEMLFDYFAVRLNGPKAWGKKIALNVNMPDLKQQYSLRVQNGVLNYGKPVAKPDANVTLNKSVFDAMQLGDVKVDDAVSKGDIRIEGNAAAFKEFVGLLDQFPFWFNIVTP
jgi:alkyl sulfatase BDS1-like metallo-beta-lactamase superfamily hydrolase